MWLRDALPYDITEAGDINPVARVMVYGYRSTLPESESTQNLEDLATSLHSSLVELASAATIKPIIFIAHSLGGLIVKEVGPPITSMSGRLS
jgi:surfactin synthase thioesterase subunit